MDAWNMQSPKANLLNTIATLILFGVHFCASGQSIEIDSLKRALSTVKGDSNHVNTLIELSKSFVNLDNSNAIHYGEEAALLAKQIRFGKGLGYAHKAIGMAYYNASNYADAYDHFEKSLTSFDSINFKVGVANMCSNMGAIMFNTGDSARAIQYHLRSLKVSEEIGDKLRIGTALNNIGAVYKSNPATTQKALHYFLNAIPIFEAINHTYGVGAISGNIGEIYFDNKQYDMALPYLATCLNSFSGTIDAIFPLTMLGSVYAAQKDFQKAHYYHINAIDFAWKLGAHLELTQSLLAFAETQMKEGRTQDAITTYKRAEKIAKPLHARNEITEIYKNLAKCYSGLDDFRNAYFYENLHNAMKDTLANHDESDKAQEARLNKSIQAQMDIKEKMLMRQDQLKAENKLQTTMIYSGFVLLIIALVAAGMSVRFIQMRKINKLINEEKEKSENLLLNILPKQIADELKLNGHSAARNFEEVTVLFTDFQDFTQMAETLSPQALVAEINACFKAFDQIITNHKIEKIKTIGDSYMVAGGFDSQSNASAKNVVMAGLEMQAFMQKRKNDLQNDHKPYFEMRVGIHTGPVVAGIVGVKKFQYDIWGDTVNTASRMESSCEVGRVNISQSTFEILKYDAALQFESRGKIEAKNKGVIEMYYVDFSETFSAAGDSHKVMVDA